MRAQAFFRSAVLVAGLLAGQAALAFTWTAVSSDPEPLGTVGHSIAVRSDGTVWVTGENGAGQLGLGDTSSRLGAWVQVPGIVNAEKVWATKGRSYIKLTNGAVFGAGDNTASSLGLDPATTAFSSFVAIPALDGLADVQGYLAVMSTGVVYKTTSMCGTNNEGFGACDGSYMQPLYTDASMETQLTNVVSASQKNLDCVVVIKADGSVWTAGASTLNGACGGTYSAAPSPTFTRAKTSSSNFFTNAAKISNFYIRKTDGTVWYIDTGSSRRYWRQVSGGSGVADISATAEYSSTVKSAIARMNDGTVKVIGTNPNGKLGNGNTSTLSSFTLINIGSADHVAMGRFASLLVKDDGTLWASGKGSAGGLSLDGVFHKQSALAQTVAQPGVVAGLTASKGSISGAVRVSWPASTDAATYTVFRNTTNAVGGIEIASGISSTTYDDVPPSLGNFYYSVVAQNAAGVSAISNIDYGWKNVPLSDASVLIKHDFGTALAAAFASVTDQNSNDAFAINVLTQPVDGTITANGLQLIFTPNAGLPAGKLSGVNSFSFEVSDKAGNSITRTGYVTQTCPAPVFSYGTVSPSSVLEVASGNAAAWYSAPQCLSNTNLAVTVKDAGGSSVKSWSAPVSDFGYNKYLDLGSVGSLPSGNYSVSITLSALRATGNLLADQSAETVVSSETKQSDYSVLAVILGESSSVAATDGTLTNQVGVNWTAIPYAEFYDVLRQPKGGSNPVVVASGVVGTSFEDLLPNDATVYEYFVRGRRGEQVGPVSVAAQGYANVVPVAASAHLTHNWGDAQATILADVSDANANDVLSLAITTQPTEGTITLFGKQLIFTPNSSLLNGRLSGTNAFVYSVTDSQGQVATASGFVSQRCPAPDLHSVSVSGALEGEAGSGSMTYSVAACVVNPVVSFKVRNASNAVVAEWQVPITVFGISKTVSVGAVPGLSTGVYQFEASLGGGVATGLLLVDNVSEVVVSSDSETVGYAVASVAMQSAAGVVVSKGTIRDKVKISWSPVENAQTYQVFRSSTLADVGTLVADNLPSTLFEDVPPDFTPYYYTVRGVRNGVYGEYSIPQQGWANGLPIAGAVHIKLNAGESSAYATANITDPNATDIHTVTILTQPADGVITTYGKQLIFTPSRNLNGVNTFSYQISDAGGETSVSNGIVTVACAAPSFTQAVALGTLAYSAGGTVMASYSANSCLQDASIVVDVLDGGQSVASWTAPVTDFGANRQVNVGEVPGLPPKDYELRATFHAKITSGDVDGGGEQIWTAFSAVKTAAFKVTTIKLPDVIASKWTANQNDDFILIEARNPYAPNCVIATEADASLDKTKCFVEWAALPEGIAAQSYNGYTRPSASGTPTAPGEQPVVLKVFKYASDNLRHEVGSVINKMTVTAQTDIAFGLDGVTTVKRAVEDLYVLFKQKAGATCQMTLDPAKAALRAQYDSNTRSCLVIFNNLPPEISKDESLTGDRIVLTGRMKEVGQLPLNYEVRRYFRDGTYVTAVNSAVMITVDEAPLPEITFLPLRKLPDGSVAFQNGGAVGKAIIMNAAAGRINMTVTVNGEVTQQMFLLRKLDARYIMAPSAVPLWNKADVKIRFAYADYPMVYTDIDLKAVSFIPNGVMLTVAAPFRVIDTDGPVPVAINIGKRDRFGINNDPELVGNWRTRLVQFVGKDVVPLTESFDLPDNQIEIEMQPDQEIISFIVEAVPVTPDDVVSGVRFYSRRVGVLVLKGGPLVGTMKVTPKLFSATSAIGFLTVAIDKPSIRALKSLSWWKSTDGGVTWKFWEGVQGPGRVDTVLQTTQMYKVKMINRNTGVESESNVVSINFNDVLAALNPAALNVAATPNSTSSSVAASSEPVATTSVAVSGEIKPINIKVAVSNGYMRVPLTVSLQSETNTGSATYSWSVNGQTYQDATQPKLTVTIKEPGSYSFKALSSSTMGHYEGVKDITAIANQVPVCSMTESDLGSVIKVLAICSDPDGKLAGARWYVDSKQVYPSSNYVYVMKQEGRNTSSVDLTVFDDSGDQSSFAKHVSY